MCGKYITANSFFKYKASLILLLVIIFLITSSKLLDSKKSTLNKFSTNINNVKTGDIIFRKENNFISDIFSKIDQSDFSHVGIVYIENNKIFVYHMEYKNTYNDIQKDSIDVFLKLAENAMIYRLKSNKKYDFKNNINKVVDQNPKFDFDFNLKNHKLYCTEFVNDIYYNTIGQDIYTYLYNYKNLYKVISIKSILNNTNLFYVYSLE